MVLLSKMLSLRQTFTFFFFNDTATTEIYTLSLHDALPISRRYRSRATYAGRRPWKKTSVWSLALRPAGRGKSRGAPRGIRTEEEAPWETVRQGAGAAAESSRSPTGRSKKTEAGSRQSTPSKSASFAWS